MRKLTILAPLSALVLAACGSPEPAEENLDAANLALNAMVANEVAVANDVADVPEAETEAPEPAPPPAPKAAPKPPATKPAPKPAEPKPAEPKPDPTCTPEHRAAGHC